MLDLKRFVLALVAVLSSCAYHAGDSRSSDQILHVFIPVLENTTARPLDLNEITSDFREYLESIKGVVIVNKAKDADIVVLGRVNQYDRGAGPSVFQGTAATETAGGLKLNSLSASSVRIILGIQIEKRTPAGEKVATSSYVESDLYQLSDRLTLAAGSAASPQIQNSREALLVRKLSDRIFRRARAQVVDNF